MADNAIDKLIEETRAAYTALEAVEKELVAVESQMTAANHRRRDAKKRCDMLDLTMKKHIHENMPVVQAKMIAHEEIEQIQSADRSFTINAVSQAVNSASASLSQSGAKSAAVNAQLANIMKWYAGRNEGRLNLSI